MGGFLCRCVINGIASPAFAGVNYPRNDTAWIPAPRLRGDKLRGNDKRGAPLAGFSLFVI